MKILRPIAAFLLGALFLFRALLSAAEPLELLPENVASLQRIQSVDSLIGHINDMLSAINPASLQVMPAVESEIADAFELPDRLDGLDRTKPAFLVQFSLPDAPYAQLWMVQGAGEGKLSQALARAKEGEALQRIKRDDGFTEVTGPGDRKFFISKRGEYSLYTRSEAVVQQVARLGTEAKSLASIMTPEAKQLLAQGDIGVFLNSRQVVKQYQTEIEQGRQGVLQFIKDLPDEQLNVASPEAVRKLYIDAANRIFDAVLDSTWTGGAVKISAVGVDASAFFDFKPDSKTDKLLAANPSSAFDNLGLLPAHASALIGYRFGDNTVNADFLKVAFGDNVKDKKAFDEGMKLLQAAKVLSVVTGFSLPRGGETAGMATTSIEESQDAKKLRRGMADVMGAVGTIKTPFMDQTTTYKSNAETYKGKAIDLLITKFSFGGGEQADLVRSMIKAMFGGESRYEARLTTVENLLVQVGGNDPKVIQQVLDNMESGEGVVGLQDTFAKTRDRLADKANLIGMLDLPWLTVDGLNMVRNVPPFGDLIGIAPFNLAAKPAPSYTGFSLGAEPHAVRAKLFVPIEQPKGILQIFVPGL